MKQGSTWVLGALGLMVWLGACGGGAPVAEGPAPAPSASAAPEPEPEPEPAPSASAAASEAPPEPEAPPPPEPKFTPGMSVNEAIAAVPQGAQRVNIDPERLGKPLMDFSRWEPCKPGDRDQVSMRVAVYDGRAVGVDVTSKNPKLAECVRKIIWGMTWAEKVPSLNTVEYSF